MTTSMQTDAQHPTKDPSQKTKTGWIRWSGIAGLGILSILGFFLSYFEAQNWVKQQLEQQASTAWGAKVEIGQVNFTLSPLGIDIQQLALTDPDNPMENLLVLSRLKGDLNLYHLVVGRVVIQNAKLQGLALHQPRQTSGALPQKASHQPTQQAATPSQNRASQANLDPLKTLNKALPSPETLLKREPLLTQQRAEQLQKDLAALEQTWQQLQQSLPNETKLKTYQQQFQALVSEMPQDLVTIQKRQLQFERLKKQVEQDKRQLEQSKRQLQQQLAKLQQSIALLKQAPAEDFQRLQAKYRMDEKGVSNLTALLFGPEVQGWLQTVQQAYAKAQPVIEYFKNSAAETEKAEQQKQRSLGCEVKFTEYDPQPSFIVQKLLFSTHITPPSSAQAAQWQLQIKDLNFEHPLYGKPTTFKSLYHPAQQSTPLVAAGMVNHVMPKQPLDKLSLEWKHYQVKDWTLLKEDRMTLKMPQATVQFNAEGRLLLNPKTQQLDQLVSQFTLAYRQVQFDLTESNAKEVKEYLVPVFNKVDQFDVQGKVTGTLWAPKVEIRSDLDRHLSQAFNQELNRRVALAKAELKAQLQQQAQAQLKPLEAQLQAYLGKEIQLDQDISQLQKILTSKLEERLEQEKQKRLDELKRKAQAELDAQKRKLQQQAQAKKRELQQKLEAEKKRQQKALEEQLKQNLKGLIKF